MRLRTLLHEIDDLREVNKKISLSMAELHDIRCENDIAINDEIPDVILAKAVANKLSWSDLNDIKRAIDKLIEMYSDIEINDI